MPVVFDVIAVVEAQHVVEPAVMAGRPARVLVVPMDRAEHQPQDVTGQIDERKELWRRRRHRDPHRDDQPGLQGNVRREPEPVADSAMMREVAIAPQRLRDPERRRQQRGDARVR